ncbi:MAG: hypothetical protein ABIS25_08935 [Sphingomicrobium sp.]
MPDREERIIRTTNPVRAGVATGGFVMTNRTYVRARSATARSPIAAVRSGFIGHGSAAPVGSGSSAGRRRELAFLAGVSLVAVGLAAPAQGATNPGVQQVTISPNVTDVITISNIGDNLVFGDYQSGASGTVTATVNAPANGMFEQVGVGVGPLPNGNVDLTGINLGTAQIDASALNSGGNAIADLTAGLVQNGSGAGTVTVGAANLDSLEIGAIAHASSSTGVSALAMVGVGIDQSAAGGPVGMATLSNSGDMVVVAAADARFAATALADASIATGVAQDASGLTADALTDNSGSFLVIARQWPPARRSTQTRPLSSAGSTRTPLRAAGATRSRASTIISEQASRSPRAQPPPPADRRTQARGFAPASRNSLRRAAAAMLRCRSSTTAASASMQTPPRSAVRSPTPMPTSPRGSINLPTPAAPGRRRPRSPMPERCHCNRPQPRKQLA